jgi:hypothetical protein
LRVSQRAKLYAASRCGNTASSKLVSFFRVFNHLLAGLIDGLFLIPLESDFYSRMEDFFLSGGILPLPFWY